MQLADKCIHYTILTSKVSVPRQMHTLPGKVSFRHLLHALKLIPHIFLRQLKVLVIICAFGALDETLCHALLPCVEAIRVATASVVEIMHTAIGNIIVAVDLNKLLVLGAQTWVGLIHAPGCEMLCKILHIKLELLTFPYDGVVGV